MGGKVILMGKQGRLPQQQQQCKRKTRETAHGYLRPGTGERESSQTL
jgi:hypothetical protein